jgi:hypothetical protein
MDAGPLIEMYKDVEIRYGYSPRDDVYYAHFALPSRESGGLLQFFRMDVTPGIMPGRQKATGHTEQEVLDAARAVIDRYFGAT